MRKNITKYVRKAFSWTCVYVAALSLTPMFVVWFVVTALCNIGKFWNEFIESI